MIIVKITSWNLFSGIKKPPEIISVTESCCSFIIPGECIVSNITNILFHSLLLKVHCASNWTNRRYPDSWLSPGTLTAPGRFCLVLLRSRPDTVHRFPSRKTRTSTSLIGGSSASFRPLHNITPAIADCRFKVPLPPRLHESIFYRIFRKMSTDMDDFWTKK